jgi:hypothetical protein
LPPPVHLAWDAPRPDSRRVLDVAGPNPSRDYLRADDAARAGWGAFKQRLGASVPDLMNYGQIKVPATEVLMAGAERWAGDTGWSTR